jgi:uncharacterized membrane protein YoaK (UPF0700 family)
MLRHTGQKRSFRHNLRLAVLLCLNAGFINAAGFLAFSVLTTNVTGHAALLAINIASSQFRATRMVALWLFLFLAGAFLSALFISKVGRNKSFAYTMPIGFIIIILLLVAIFGHHYNNTLPQNRIFCRRPFVCYGHAECNGTDDFGFGSKNHSFNRHVYRFGN